MFWCFDELLRKRLQKVAQFVKKHEKSSIWPNLCNFSNKLPCLCISMNFSGKSCKKCLISWKSTKNYRFGQNFHLFLANYHVLAFSWTFQQEVAKSASFRGKAREIIDLAKTMQLFRTNYHVFAFRSTFQEKVAKSASFRETARKIIDLAKALQLLEQATMSFSFWRTFKKKVAKSASSREKARKIIDFVNLQLSEKTTMFSRFDEHCSKKLQKAARAVKKHEKSSICPNLCNFLNKLRCFCISMNFQGKSCQKCFVSWKSTHNHRFCKNFAIFRANYHVLAFRWSFQQKVTKSASFREKARKIVDLAKTRNFSNKLPCFGVSMNFWAKGCKKLLNSWKSTKNHRFGQNFLTFRTNYHVFAFRWTFPEKVAKSASFREKARKIVDLAKTRNFSNKLPCFDALVNFSAKSCRKCLVFWENSKNHRLGQNLQLFRTKYHVYAFRWTFQTKVAKSASFREKARTLIDLAKTYNFSNKLPCFGISMNFSGKKCKKWPVSWKSTNTHRFGQNLQLFEQTTMFWHFDEHFRIELQKVAHFVKKHEKRSIWPKLATFGANYHVLAFSWTFQQGGAKSASFRGKARETIDLANTMQLFEQTTMFLHFDELLRKRLEKVVHLVKKHEKSWIWSKLATFRTNCHVFVFRWTFKEKVGKSGSFREKARKLMHFLKTCNFSKKLPCFDVSMNFSAKSCKKCLISWKNTKDHRFGQTMQLFRTNYHVLVFRWTFEKKVAKSCSIREKARKIIHLAKSLQLFEQTTMSLHFDELFRKKLQKVPHFVKKHEKLSIWPKLSPFFSKLPCLGIFMNFSARSCKKCLISWKSTRNHWFGQDYATFSNKLPCLCISINFSGKSCKKCLISWNSTKNHWFGQSFATFGTSYNVFLLLTNFQEKSCKKCVVSWKSTKNHRFCQLATFRENYHVFTFRWTLQQKVAKSCSCREKARKIINLPKSLQLFEQTSRFLHFDEFSRKKLPKVLRFVKKHA